MKTRKLLYLYRSFCVCIVLSGIFPVQGQNKNDSIQAHVLKEVQVKALHPSETRALSPLQIMKKEEFNRLNALQISDAVKFFSGVQVKDYGGVGGLKTISVRGLEANYTTVFYDGVPVSDYQTGQTDLGQFSSNLVSMISLQIGETDDILQPARARASAGLLNINTQISNLPDEKEQQISASVNAGSFGLINPRISYEQKLNKNLTTGLSAEYLKNRGNYPYTSGSGERKTRENSDVETWKFEGNLSDDFSNGGNLSGKLYAYRSDRSLPCADVYYTNAPGEHLYDENYFAQVRYVQPLSEKFELLSIGKFNFMHTDYSSSANGYSRGNIFTYYQQEYYTNATLKYNISHNLSVSWANDGTYGTFENKYTGIFPKRTSWQSALATKWEIPLFTFSGSILSTYAHDEVNKDPGNESFYDLSPYIGISVKPIKNSPFRIRAFYKKTFRQPTFADLYAAPVPPLGLKPEKAGQYNAGITWSGSYGKLIPIFSLTADAYHNKINDKILTSAEGSMYLWSTQNIGNVNIKGVDLVINMQMLPLQSVECGWGLNYTYQNALNKTNPEKKSYNQQIMYTPKHSASGYAYFTFKDFSLNYSLLYSGERYFEQVNRPEYKMDPYNDQSLALSKIVRWKSIRWTIIAACLNLADKQYEIVRSYPMPGRSFRFTLKFDY